MPAISYQATESVPLRQEAPVPESPCPICVALVDAALPLLRRAAAAIEHPRLHTAAVHATPTTITLVLTLNARDHTPGWDIGATIDLLVAAVAAHPPAFLPLHPNHTFLVEGDVVDLGACTAIHVHWDRWHDPIHDLGRK